MIANYVDAHCHIQFGQYSDDRAELVQRMLEEGIAGIVVGVDGESSEKAIELAEKHEHLFASVGLHPNSVGLELFDKARYRKLATHQKVVAIGECGLDFFHSARADEENMRSQSEVLRAHIALAAELNKPLIVHCRPSKGTRNAYEDLIAILQEAKREHQKLNGDIHFFAGSLAEAQTLIALDFYISFAAVITFARDYDDVIKGVPLEKIISETDAPYAAPVSRRGKRNDPLAVADIVLEIAKIRGEDFETVKNTVLANSKRLFALPALL